MSAPASFRKLDSVQVNLGNYRQRCKHPLTLAQGQSDQRLRRNDLDFSFKVRQSGIRKEFGSSPHFDPLLEKRGVVAQWHRNSLHVVLLIVNIGPDNHSLNTESDNGPVSYSVIGETVSHYRIIERLGGGGMGVVYKALDLRLDRFVAIKFLPPELTRDEEANKRFMQEAKAASALDHPHICTFHEIDQTPSGQVFLVMTCYEGETLKKRIDRGPLAVEEALQIPR
jgi:hypothetical protein